VLFDDLDSHRRSIWAGETDRHIPSGCSQLPEEKAKGRVPETIDNVDSRAGRAVITQRGVKSPRKGIDSPRPEPFGVDHDREGASSHASHASKVISWTFLSSSS